MTDPKIIQQLLWKLHRDEGMAFTSRLSADEEAEFIGWVLRNTVTLPDERNTTDA